MNNLGKGHAKFKVDRVTVVIIGALAAAGVLTAILLVSIADRSEKSVQEIKNTPVKKSFNYLENMPTNAEALADMRNYVANHANDERLVFANIAFDEDAFSKLANLKRVKRLSLESCEFDNEWLRHIEHLTGLEEMECAGSQINDNGLKFLSAMSKLRYLGLSECDIKDEGLAYLPPHLVKIDLYGTHVTDAGLTHLKKFDSLHYLNLGQTKVDDQGCKTIAQLKTLMILTLTGTRVSDKGLAELKSLRSLQVLTAYHCPLISKAGLKPLQQAIPRLNIELIERQKHQEVPP